MEALVEYDYNSEEGDELSIRKGDKITNVSQFEEGWYIGTLNGREGVFPDNFVKIIEDRTQKTNMEARQVNSEDVFDGSSCGVRGQDFLKVVYQYTPEHSDELQLQVNDIIRVVDRNSPEDGWWRGQNMRTKQIGVFPDNFVIPLDSSDNELRTFLPELRMDGLVTPQSANLPKASEPAVIGSATHASAGDVYQNKAGREMGISKNPPTSDSSKIIALSEFGSFKRASVGDVHTAHCLPSVTADRPLQENKRPPSKISNAALSTTIFRSDTKPAIKQEQSGRNAISNHSAHKPANFVRQSSLSSRKSSGRLEKSDQDSSSTYGKNSSATNVRPRVSSVGRADTLRNAEVNSKQLMEMQQAHRDTKNELQKCSINVNNIMTLIEKLRREQAERSEELALQIRSVKKQMETMQESHMNLKADFSRNQNMLIDRIHCLMQEIDELQKSRSADSVDMERIKKITQHLDIRALAAQFNTPPIPTDFNSGKVDVNRSLSKECLSGCPRVANAMPRK